MFSKSVMLAVEQSAYSLNLKRFAFNPDLWGHLEFLYQGVRLQVPSFYVSLLKLYVLGWATSITPHSTASDPAEVEALRCLEQGTAKLEEGDVQAAKSLYQRSAEIKRNASSLFNLGVTHYHLSMLT